MSAVPIAKGALLTITTAAVAPLSLSSSQVSWGWPAQLAESEYVWLDDAVTNDADSVGLVSHRETFVVPIIVYVKAEGDDHQAAETRAWALEDAIEAAIRANPSLSNATHIAQATVTAKTPVSGIADGARVVNVVIDVEVRSRY